MTPDDWQKGMENEAASVEDGVWAGEVQQAIRRQKQSRILRVLSGVTLGYVLLGGLIDIGMNAVSLGYGPPALHTFLFGFHLFPDMNFTPAIVIPVLVVAALVRAGISKRLVWLVPVCSSLTGLLISRVVTITIPSNLPGIGPDVRMDLLPSGLESAADLLLTLGMNILAILLGVVLGQLLRRRHQRTLA